ncbi:cytochrome c biogenesis CcdA family protein [Nitrosomonas sp. Nm33]|uniref:cytochrome c biogenesis CcdA family protein n=1 Tax=Nitrosomonas sp. Nm33 TaxID=133724 RepID=UPI0008984A70|nr:cytochrome c biogenesis protein CcdA [Nitrosomonas sp. Nm33]SDY04003.1 Cytochrome c biogenesis protein CcdA [Nitrosomonas sp. Nm33]
MMDIQVLASQLMSELVGMLQVGYAFGAGMVTAVNPCGFAMLPVYLALYLGAKDQQFQQHSWLYRLSNAFGITVAVTAGFGLLYGLIGILIAAGWSILIGIMPWVSAIIGAILIVLGVWLFLGNQLTLDIFMKIGSRIGDPRTISVWGFFLFGMAMGTTSMSCALPVFLVVVGSSTISGNFVMGLLQFFWYILGVGTVLLILTISIVFLKERAVVETMKRFVPFFHKISAILLICAGVYICYYWLTSGLLF